MAEDAFRTELASLLSRHGVGGVQSPTSVQKPIGGGAVASYIKEIITGDQAFDERVLERVVGVLKTPGG